MESNTRNTLRLIRFAAFGVIALLAATVGAVLLLRPAQPAFVLTSMDGTEFDGASLVGKPYAMFFGFTHCPDVCPTTMQEVADVLDAAGPAAKDFRVLFVSVDPERDTPALLKSYLGSFDPRIIGLTGHRANMEALAKRNSIFFEKVGSGDSYTFNHTASVLLFDRAGALAGTFGANDTPENRLKKLQRLLAG